MKTHVFVLVACSGLNLTSALVTNRKELRTRNRAQERTRYHVYERQRGMLERKYVSKAIDNSLPRTKGIQNYKYFKAMQNREHNAVPVSKEAINSWPQSKTSNNRWKRKNNAWKSSKEGSVIGNEASSARWEKIQGPLAQINVKESEKVVKVHANDDAVEGIRKVDDKTKGKNIRDVVTWPQKEKKAAEPGVKYDKKSFTASRSDTYADSNNNLRKEVVQKSEKQVTKELHQKKIEDEALQKLRDLDNKILKLQADSSLREQDTISEVDKEKTTRNYKNSKEKTNKIVSNATTTSDSDDEGHHTATTSSRFLVWPHSAAHYLNHVFQLFHAELKGLKDF